MPPPQGINVLKTDYTPVSSAYKNVTGLEWVSLFDYIYPVGSIYFSVNATNPSNLFGGTWEAWGQGRVPVGVDYNDFDFNTPERMDGSKELQEHKHGTYNISSEFTGTTSNTIRSGVHSHMENLATQSGAVLTQIPFASSGSLTGRSAMLKSDSLTTSSTFDAGVVTGESGEHVHSFTPKGTVASQFKDTNGNVVTDTKNEGTGNSGNLQPYITCFMWKRTA